LRHIDGFSRLLLDQPGTTLDGTGRDYLGRVRSAVQRMAELIDDLLQLSRVGRADLRRQAVDLSALARSVAAEVEQAEPTRSVGWVIADRLVVEGDLRLLRIVFENLLGNAWKFTSRAPHAVVEVGRREEGGQSVFFVRDNGAGFEPTHAHRLFAPFQRLHSEREFPGTGIGLATVQRIVRRHGGRVWAEGAPGAGATMSFTIPVVRAGASVSREQ
jgi:signal transduction histidine kinase